MGKRGPAVKNKMATAIATDVPMKPNKEQMERERRYKAEDALRDMERVEGHKKDKGLMKDVKQLSREKMDNLKKIAK